MPDSQWYQLNLYLIRSEEDIVVFLIIRNVELCILRSMSWLHEKHFNSSLVSSEMTNKTFIRQIISFFLKIWH